MYYRGAQAAIVVYDITNSSSFQRAKSWVNELNEKANAVKVIALAGNKKDLEEHRAVPTEVSSIVNVIFLVVTWVVCVLPIWHMDVS